MKVAIWIPGWLLLLGTLQMGCGDPATRVGQVCQSDEHCGTEQGIVLSCDFRIPGGACTAIGCTPDDPVTDALEDETTCPVGSRCKEDAQGTACHQECQATTDCREVIACSPVSDCQDPEGCGEACIDAMTCELLDPQASTGEEDEEPARVCVFSGN